MTNRLMETSDFRLLIPEEIWLEQEDYDLAKQLSEIEGTEDKKWQAYINLLGMFALEKWLKENIYTQDIQRIIDRIDTYGYLQRKGFKFCLITQEDFLQEGMIVPRELIYNSDHTAHFYVAMEVLEEEEIAIIRGFISYDKLSQLSLPTIEDNNYWLFLDYLDPEPNHLLMTYKYLEPSTIILPQNIVNQVQENVQEAIINLSNWLEGMLEESWQNLEQLINTDAGLNFATRSLSEEKKVGKFIRLQMEFDEQIFVLLLTISPTAEDKLRIQVQLYPTNNQTYLSSEIKLRMYSKSGKLVKEVIAGKQDNYIQLPPFSASKDRQFKIEVNLNNASITETFRV
ncbi:hypothetical protein cce_2162 [Crocosphaera subtropica ATCC 51142]|uniref:DUF1822 family protein n=1 Tax=Crocosphaera subtropica (strain ATCC 51142 / BH68) TaxID=43989 RepID=B1WNT3_CROS5|nr:DUF1822 family protein [Crocosphaera subtropica]ACB51512.1 hypothetical protein cce_2162 [Crocosphaera subtropica ATCC 51142]